MKPADRPLPKVHCPACGVRMPATIDICDACGGKMPRKPQKFTANGRILRLENGLEAHFKHRIDSILEYRTVVVVMVDIRAESSDDTYLFGVAKKTGLIRWQMASKHNPLVGIYRNSLTIVRAFAWDGDVIDIHASSGKVRARYMGR